ncbi:MAG: response regulator [Devosia sp.]|uniref:response regulator n=1 Tax=Devosia sp. TaxID=1871048 RepID=UPI00260CC77E|nr:response regulator [Devosia sp.]MDB5539570.1 response regulator [Devosia sp.]
MQKPGFSRLDVLVVDPSAHMAALIGQMLRHLKVRLVEEAVNSDGAALLLQSHRFGAIMMNDVLMPMNGIALVRALRAASGGLNRDTPVIMMSSNPDAGEIAEARDAGITEFLRKPFAAADIEKRLASILAAPRPFIEADAYAGPDRRRRQLEHKGGERRAGVKRQA